MTKMNQRGFSLVELLIVMAVIMVLAAIALPNLDKAILRYRIVSSARNTASLVLTARREAARKGRRIGIKWEYLFSEWVALYIDANGNNVYDAGEAKVSFPRLRAWPCMWCSATLPDPDYGTVAVLGQAGATMSWPYSYYFAPDGTMTLPVVGTVPQQWQMDTRVRGIYIVPIFVASQSASAFYITVTPSGTTRLWAREYFPPPGGGWGPWRPL